MSEKKCAILECWPALKDDLRDFLSDTDAWIISELTIASEARDWGKVESIIGVMETVHNISHAH